MKKLLYSLMGCAALLTVGTATGRDAIAQVYTNITAPSDEGTTTGEYLKSAQVVDLMINFMPEQDNVKISFTSPRIAYWSISGDYEEITKVDAIRIYRNEGLYYDEENRELLHEIKNVPSGTEIEWIDQTKLKHGVYWYYMIIPVIDGNDGQTAGRSEFIGWSIDPATNFQVLPGDQGAIEATVKFTAPTTANDGAVNVTEPIKIEIGRKDDGLYSSFEVIHTIENAEPGKEYEYVDNDSEALEAGTKYKYRLSIYYDGSVTTSTAYNQSEVLIGPDKPAAPSNLVAVAEGDNVRLAWDAPTSGVNNGWFDPSTLCYKVERAPYSFWPEYQVIATGLETTEFLDDQIAEEGVFKYRITAYAGEIEGSSVTTNEEILAGPAVKMPYCESWAGGSARYSTWDRTGYIWSTSTGIDIPDLNVELRAFDGDGGFLFMQPMSYSNEVGDRESAITGRIDLKDAVNPILKFSYFDFDPEYSDNELKVYVSADGGEFVELDDLDMHSGPGLNQWVIFTTSLSKFAGAEFIKVKFEVTIGSKFAKFALDAVEVREIMPVDLVINSVSAPDKFYPGAKMMVSVSVENTGDDASAPFDAVVTLGDNEVATGNFPSLNGHSSIVLELPVDITDETLAGDYALVAAVESDVDADPENNTASKDVEVVALPSPSNLSLALGVLNWDAVGELPFSDSDKEVYEQFVDCEHGVTGTFGDWTFVDNDGLDTYNIPGSEEDYPNKNTNVSGMVLNPVLLGPNWTVPEEGTQCFIFIGCQGEANDWLISPKLNGLAQTLTFKAMAPAGYGSEYFDLMISYTDNQTESFSALETYKLQGNSGIGWTDYSVEIPAGVKYFALHCTTSYGDALCLTDFRFTTGYGLISEATVFQGYNIYCNAEKINPELVTETTYTLSDDAPKGSYTVKAVYNNAESFATTPVDYQGSSSVTGVGEGISPLSVEGTTLVISGDGAYAVVDLAGRTVAAGDGAARVVAAPGTYVVTVDGNVFKVVLK